MKYIALLALVLTLFFTSQASAAYPLTATKTSSSITATLAGVTGSTSTFELFVRTEPFPAGEYTNTLPNIISGPAKPTTTTGTVTWTVPATSNTTYYLRVVERPAVATPALPKKPFYTTDVLTLTTPMAVITPGALTFEYNSTTTSVLVNGKIDVAKNPSFPVYQIRIQYSKNAITDADPAYKVFQGTETVTQVEGIAPNGTYHVRLNNISPSTKYFVRETITYGGTTKVTDGTFNSNAGYVPSTDVTATQSDFESRSYRLLAPFPGFTLFLDPDLCAEQAQINPNQLCDINDILNLAFKILIGAAAVLLVLRIMFEGYKYITSDIPGLKTSAKSNIVEAGLGLLLALSSFLILNTINPKLVENSIDAGRLEIGVERTIIDAASFLKLTGQKKLTKSEYSAAADRIASAQGVDACIVKATIQVESGWDAGAIGCDENVPRADVPSRIAFVQSGIKLDGTKFTATSSPTTSVKNNCSFDIDKAQTGYGLDWRFSKGGGLMQVTVEPTAYKSTGWYEGVKEGKKYWSTRTTPSPGWETLLNEEENITRGTKRLKVAMQACGNDPRKIFSHYQSNNCNGISTTVVETVNKKMSYYNSCKAGN